MIGVIIVTVTAFLLALFITFIDQRFKLDNKEEQFAKLLPGYNCGACGYGTCQGLAKEMVNNPYYYEKCKPLRGESLKKMAEMLKENNLI